MGKTLPPGFRFHPTHVELVKYYLKRKVLGKKFPVEAITELDIYKHEPSDLPEKSCLKGRDLNWYFFSPREKKYSRGVRIKRATETGYWKTTGKDRSVTYNGEVAGMIKTLVFHHGRAPGGDRTNWVMHEYRLEDKSLSDIQDSYVLCVIFQKSGPGPRNGAQYGAPFKEEDWTDDEEEKETSPKVGSTVPISSIPNAGHLAGNSQICPSKFIGLSSVSCVSGTETQSLQLSAQQVLGNDIGRDNTVASRPLESPLESCLSDEVGPSRELPPSVIANNIEADMLPVLNENDVLSFLNQFADEDTFMVDTNENIEATNNSNQIKAIDGAFHSDGNDVFEGLDDLGNLAGLSKDEIGVSTVNNTSHVFDDENNYYLELLDLCTPLVRPGGNNVTDDKCPDAVESSHFRVNGVDMWPGQASGSEDPCHVNSFQRY